MSERITVRVAEGAPRRGSVGGSSSPASRHPACFGSKREGLFRTAERWRLRHPQAVIRFGLIGMGIAPAGVDKANTGHHHLIVDAALPPLGEPIPTDFNHLHFGAGQTEAQITLTPGRHTLQLLLGDASHVPHDPPVFSKQITVIASESGRRPGCSPYQKAFALSFAVGQTMIKLVRTWVIVALCGSSCVLLSTDAARADRKVALVVGNSQYKNPGLVLLNPKNDAEDVAAALRGWILKSCSSWTRASAISISAMTQFARMATGADAAFFYYAGHAMQFQGRNYLMPTDGELEDEASLRYQMVMVDDVRAAVERADGVKIVVLDACRNNPVVDDLRRKMVGVSRNIATTRGLARPDKALGMIVAYSTAADEVAADGTGRNSPFTSALLRRLREPGLEIGSMFRLIAADVNEKTNGRQRPETYISLIGEYYLNEKDKPAWEQIKDSTDPAAFRSFIAQFPTSPRASDAQYRLRILERLAKQFDLNGPASDQRPVAAAAGAARLRAGHQQPPPADNNRPKTATAEPKRLQPSGSDTKSGPRAKAGQRDHRAREGTAAGAHQANAGTGLQAGRRLARACTRQSVA